MLNIGLTKVFSRRSSFILVLANLVPLIEILFFGLNLSALMLIYWIEACWIILFNLPKMLMISAHSKNIANPLMPTMIIYAVVGYGLFIAFQLVLLLMLFGPPKGAIILPAIILLLSYCFSFFDDFFLKRIYKTRDLDEQKNQPYDSVVVVQTEIMLSAVIVKLLGAPMAAIILLLVVKVILDLNARFLKDDGYGGTKTELENLAKQLDRDVAYEIILGAVMSKKYSDRKPLFNKINLFLNRLSIEARDSYFNGVEENSINSVGSMESETAVVGPFISDVMLGEKEIDFIKLIPAGALEAYFLAIRQTGEIDMLNNIKIAEFVNGIGSDAAESYFTSMNSKQDVEILSSNKVLSITVMEFARELDGKARGYFDTLVKNPKKLDFFTSEQVVNPKTLEVVKAMIPSDAWEYFSKI